MAAKRSVVTLTDAERPQLLALTRKGQVAARRLTRTPRRLQAAAGATQEAMATALHIGRATVVRICKRCVEEGLEAALGDRPRPGAQRQRDGQPEAFRLALACRMPPEGRQGWTMPWLADKVVERRVVEVISEETGRRTRQQTS